MKWSQTAIRTLREDPISVSIKSHKWMVRSDLIQPLASGLFIYGPFMVRALQKFEAIIQKELNQQGFVEIFMPMVQPKEIWNETGRWEMFSEILQKIKNRSGQEFCLGPTHEEVVTDYARHHVKSYRDLPFYVYQIQTKYRDEIRPRFGLLRAREFAMKDAYSFDLDKESALATYTKMEQTYHNIFSQLGVRYCVVQADSGAIGGDYSKEFHILADEGEDSLIISKDGSFAVNKELAQPEDLKRKDIVQCRGIEVGHIFYLGQKYSKDMKAGYLNSSGKNQWIEMGCYGIGLSRTIQAVIEQSHDEQGIIWPQSITPFTVHLVALNKKSESKVMDQAQKIYQFLWSNDVDCFLDDRQEAPGVKFKDADLLGFPLRVVVGEKDLENQQVEVVWRKSGKKKKLNLKDLESQLLKFTQELTPMSESK